MFVQYSSKTYELSEFQPFVVARTVRFGMIIISIVSIALGTPFFVSEQDTIGIEYLELAFAKDLELTYDAFLPQSSILVGDKLVFTAPDKTSTNSITPGTISVVDTKTGSLLYTIESPRQDVRDDWFGKYFASVGNNIAASSSFSDPDTKKWTTLIHVFDGSDGSLLYTIDNPVSYSMYFGNSLASIGNYLAVYASDEDPNDDKHSNVIHVFDGSDGSLLYTIDNPRTYGDFGRSLEAFDDKLLVAVSDYRNDKSLPDLIYSFDIENGELLYTIEYPQQQIRHAYMDNGGIALITDDNIVVRSNDAMFVYDGNTGELLHTEEGFATTNSKLQTILYSIGNDDYDDSFIILVTMITLGVVVLGIVLFKKMKK